MILKSLRYMVGLGIVGGLAMVSAPRANAQTTTTTSQTTTTNGIEVTGGSIGGQAAFFVPGMNATGGNVTLFDVGIQELSIESTNGNTTTAHFEPTAASFDDVNTSGTPDTGDTPA